MVRFLYLRDPLFLSCVATYCANRFVLKPLWPSGFAHEHLNDLICIPFCVPIMLYVQRRVGLRESDGRPSPAELVLPLILWSWIFEILLPQLNLPGKPFVADHVDILCYALGTLIAGLFWTWWYRQKPKLQLRISSSPLPGTEASPQ